MENTSLSRPIPSISEIQQVARLLAASGYFDAKGASEQAIAQIATKILAGAEMGYGPFASVQGIHVIQGRPAMSANLMAAAVKASQRYDYRVRQMDESGVQIEFFERVAGRLESLGVSTFTADDAKKAGTQNMAKFARNMMFARAMSNGVRWFCPDVFFGAAVYTPEELGAPVDGDGNVIDVDHRMVEQSTGEIKPPAHPAPTPTNGNGNGNGNGAQPASKPVSQPVEVPPEVAAWQTPDDAYEWSVSIGASANVFAARNAFMRIVDEHGGRLTRQNAPEIYQAFWRDRTQRLADKAAALELAAAATEAETPPAPQPGQAPAPLFAAE